MDNILIVPVVPTDLAVLREISIDTFREAFGAQNSAEHMTAYIESALSEGRLAQEMANESSKFFFAHQAGKLAGYLKVNFSSAQTEIVEGLSMEIERIYVFASAYGSGVGQALLNKAIELAGDAVVSVVWLGVWEHNERAQRFYSKNGFEAFGTHIFYLGTDAQIDVLMKRAI